MKKKAKFYYKSVDFLFFSSFIYYLMIFILKYDFKSYFFFKIFIGGNE